MLTLILFLIVPNTNTPLISLNPHEQYYEIGSNVTLTCSVSDFSTPIIGVNATIIIMWLMGSISILNKTFAYNRNTFEYSLDYHLNNLQLTDSTQYTCIHYISANDDTYIMGSVLTENSIVINIRSKE